MMGQEIAAVTERLRRALLAFQIAQTRLLISNHRLKGLPQVELDAFWDGPGRGIEATARATATEADNASNAASEAGLGTGTTDQRIIAAAQRYLVGFT